MKKRFFCLSILLCTLNPFLSALSHAETTEINRDQTILLNQSAIKGDRLEVEKDVNLFQKREDLPALSTALRWEGNDMIELDIPKEILDQLTQPDLSYILERGSDSE